ncbi:unconventional myosin-XIX isoform X2 [Nerophis lumbriciformis]|uniref:unconventional myosin-XIX isoform X2 n=1 Tax=Nerophis lumbriciformis TaxID=546530 RepID=UPI002AE0A222|nr:unconventional myosin-XIX-like isoform X2 [Nerophis lumbriciformis]
MSSVSGRRHTAAKNSNGNEAVQGFVQKVYSSDGRLHDSLEEEMIAFLTDDEAQLHTYDDLTKVNPVTPTTVLLCLQARYGMKVFYTHAGCTLVALNPFRSVPDLYSLDTMTGYHCTPKLKESKPHIFIVAEEAYRNVKGQLAPVDQSLVVSGESGAGKMMKEGTDAQRKEWNIPHGHRFVWLPNVEKSIEEDSFHETVDAMVHMGINTERQRQIFRILAGLLHLGNMKFFLSADESQPCTIKEQSKECLQRAAELLQLAADELEMCLSVRTLKAGKHSIHKPCSQAECCVRRDCLAKVIYAQLFEWLVTFINNSICADKSTWCNFIGVLDVYGFECFQTNNLEQLCINYANEKLQQHFVAHYLRAQQEEYVSEGLQWSFVKYQDNQCCLDLLEGSPISVFSLLDEESRLNRASDAKVLRIRLEKELSDNGSISWDKFSKVPHFTVAHYAGKVNYKIQSMVEKNKDPVAPEIISILQKSGNCLLQHIFIEKESEHSPNRALSKVTVVSKFKNSLERLMSILHTTTPHYTRCIKPNSDCKPFIFKKEEVIIQLEACGIVETIHISAAGFPIRIPFKCFIQRYGAILQCSNIKSQTPNLAQVGSDIDFLLQEVQKVLDLVFQHSAHNVKGEHKSLVHCGRTKVFLTQLMLDLLEDKRKTILSKCAFSIQCCWMRYQRRRRHERHHSATLIQAVVRSWLVRRRVQRWDRAAASIQKSWRKWKALLKCLAEAELDNAEDFMSEDTPVIREQGSVQLSTIQEPVMVQGWPMGLALASAPSISVSLTATVFQKMKSVVASLKLPSRRGEYKVETNQNMQGVASIRAQPKGSVKLHCQRSPLLYADMQPELRNGVTGFNEILLEKTL